MFPTNLQESTIPIQASGSAITLLGEFSAALFWYNALDGEITRSGQPVPL
jgi:hypothetical protein